MLKKMLRLCADGQIVSKHIDEQIKHFRSFEIISEKTSFLSNQTKANIYSGGGGREIYNFTQEMSFAGIIACSS